MNLRTAVPHIMSALKAGVSVICLGDPGIGKSDLMAKLAKLFYVHIKKTKGANARVGFSRFFMATQSPLGFTGHPWKGVRTWLRDGQDVTRTVTDPALPQWYMATCLDTGEVLPAFMFDAVLLIIEEWGQGSIETKRAGAEVLLARGTPPFYLPEGSACVALSNIDSRDGITKEIDITINRVMTIRLTGDPTIWLEDFAAYPYEWNGRTWNVSPATKTWVQKGDGAGFLLAPRPEKQGAWCTYRSLTAADRYVQCAAEDNNGKVPLRDPGFIESLEGSISMGAAQSLITTLQFTLELPSVEQIASDPMGTPVPLEADKQLLMVYLLAGFAQKEHLPGVIKYISKGGHPRMAQDLSKCFVDTLFRREPHFAIEPAVQKWISQNAFLVNTTSSAA